jgi:hypothetical protein
LAFHRISPFFLSFCQRRYIFSLFSAFWGKNEMSLKIYLRVIFVPYVTPIFSWSGGAYGCNLHTSHSNFSAYLIFYNELWCRR